MRETQPKVSVTISTYNVEEYVEASLNTIINQTLSDIEIICIDDGSKDNTPNILKSLAQKDPRVKLLIKPINEGLAVARNKALELAQGKYVTFLDGDDLYDENLIKKAYTLAEKEESDMVLWDYQSFTDEKELDNFNKNSALSSINHSDKIRLLQRPAFTWVRLLRTEKAKELGIHFPKGRTRQDIPVHWHLVTTLEKISLLPEKLAFYRQQPNATTAKKDQRVFDLAKVMDVTRIFLLENNLYETYKDEFLRQRLNLLYGMYDSIQTKYREQAKSMISQRLGNNEWAYINSQKPLRRQARLVFKSFRGNKIAKIERYFWLSIRSTYRLLKNL